MPIRHVAIIELHADCPSADRDDLVAQILALGHEVPDVLAMSAGVAQSAGGTALNRICLISDHPSAEALASYLEHPAHHAVATRVGQWRKSVVGADFEVTA